MAEMGSPVGRSPVAIDLLQVFVDVLADLFEQVRARRPEVLASSIHLKFGKPDADTFGLLEHFRLEGESFDEPSNLLQPQEHSHVPGSPRYGNRPVTEYSFAENLTDAAANVAELQRLDYRFARPHRVRIVQL